MKKTASRFGSMLVLAVTVGMALISTPRNAPAQIDPMFAPFYIYENGQVTGAIYVPPHASAELYVEHWILFPNYVNPSGTNGMKMSIVPNPSFQMNTQADFFRAFPLGAGFRYIEVTAHDTTSLPGRTYSTSTAR